MAVKQEHMYRDGGVAGAFVHFGLRILLVGLAAAIWAVAIILVPESAGQSTTAFAALVIVHVIGCFGCCKALGCFDLGFARVRDLVAWYALAALLADVVLSALYAVMTAPAFLWLATFIAWVAQALVGALIIVLMNGIYYRITPLSSVCAILSDDEYEKVTLAKLANKTDRFTIERVFDEYDVDASQVKDLAPECNTLVVGDVRPELRRQILEDSFAAGRTVLFIPTVAEILFGGYRAMQVSDSLLISGTNQGLTLEQRFVKRAVDIIGAVVGLIISAIPIAVCAVIIKRTDGGSVFYKQQRLTCDGKVFTAYKLRSMRMDAEKEGARLTTADDDRITPIGRFMRKYRLDETPQFWNILKGDMSLVGPRSERLETSEAYTAADPAFAYRLKVKTGLTGYAQIHGYYSTSYEDKLRMDLHYIQHWSLGGDFALMLATLKVLFSSESTAGFDVAEIDALMESSQRALYEGAYR